MLKDLLEKNKQKKLEITERNHLYKASEHKTVVIDAIMGSGKTYDAINDMKMMMLDDQKFIYVTPFLAEVERVRDQVRGLVSPFIEIKAGSLKNKRDQFLKLIKEGLNIATTHSLFSTIIAEDYKIFKDYILILDEVVQPIELLDYSNEDIEIIVNSHFVSVSSKGKVTFDNSYKRGRLLDFKKLCDNGTVYVFNDSFLIWAFPPIIFKSFKQVRVMTYLFEGSLLRAYFKMHKISYDKFIFEDELAKKRVKELLYIPWGI
jgi:hypothetical protein